MSPAQQPRLSVVVAASDAVGTVADCLASLEQQTREVPAEIIVVDDSRDGTSEIVAERFPNVRHVRCAERARVPELWRDGIKQCRGEVIVLTIAHCVPGNDWLRQIRAAHAEPYAAVGGSIEKETPSTLTDWAIYLCRYSAYMPPLERSEVVEIAGDNASYKAAVLARYRYLMEPGFWEPVIHAAMRADGHRLLRDPRVAVSYVTSVGILRFMRQRFQHGRMFARQRALPPGFVYRLGRAVASPVIPIVMAARIASRVRSRARRYTRPFVRSFPILLLFLAAWSIGEMVGYLRPRLPRPIPQPDLPERVCGSG